MLLLAYLNYAAETNTWKSLKLRVMHTTKALYILHDAIIDTTTCTR